MKIKKEIIERAMIGKNAPVFEDMTLAELANELDKYRGDLANEEGSDYTYASDCYDVAAVLTTGEIIYTPTHGDHFDKGRRSEWGKEDLDFEEWVEWCDSYCDSAMFDMARAVEALAAKEEK